MIEYIRIKLEGMNNMTEVIFVRHGYSEGNLKGEFHGHMDGDLTPMGHNQAESAGEYLFSTKKVDRIYSSDLRRTYKTAEHIASKYKLDIICDNRLREIYAGKWEGESFATLEEKYPALYEVWTKTPEQFESPEGESMREVYDRLTNTIAELAKENDGKTIVVVTHATPIRCLSCSWAGGGLELFNSIEWVKNASVSDIIYDGDKITPIFVGYCDFLGDAKTELPKNI